jgi:hypothetical protein
MRKPGNKGPSALRIISGKVAAVKAARERELEETKWEILWIFIIVYAILCVDHR